MTFIEGKLHLHFFPSSIYLKTVYSVSIGHKLHLKNPVAFTEKLQWMKLYDRNPKYTNLTDKIAVKDYIEKRVGTDYVIPTLGIWKTAEEVAIDELPDTFVIKCNHDCNSIVFFDKRKDNWKEKIPFFARQLRENYYFASREWSYKHIKPRIMAEPLLCDKNGGLIDYKFFCFNGKVQFFKMDFDRYKNHRANYYNRKGDYLDFGEKDYPRDPNRKVEMPSALPKMLEIAERLSEDFVFLRVDMYNIDGMIKVGELTLYPGSGLLRYDPNDWDYTIGEFLALPKKKCIY